MTDSKFCLQQRQYERQRLNKLLVFSFASSALLHGILAYVLPQWSFKSANSTQEPMEIIILDKPEPQPKSEPKPKVESKPVVEPEPQPKSEPKPKVESKPVVEPEPKPLPQPEPVTAKTPPPPVQAPEPVKTPTTPPKPAPAPKQVLTSPTPAPSQPILSAPVKDTARPTSFGNSFTANNSSLAASVNSSGSNPGTPGAVAVGSSAPPRPEPSSGEGISCVSNCDPEYPAALEGAEGSAGVELTIDSNGNVIGAKLASANSNSQLNRQALLAVRQMKFSSPNSSNASVQVKINFTVAGSQYDRAAQQEQRERQEQEAERQQKLEAEQQARQEQLERERQARQRQEQLEQQQTESQPQQPAVASPAESKPMPAPAETEVDDEMLRKFRQRIEQYQEQ